MTKTEKQHKDKLANIGCMVCRRVWGINDGPVELHHIRTGGWGKGDYTTMFPLCVSHHRGKEGVHGMGTKLFERHYQFTQQDLLDEAHFLINYTKGSA